MTILQLQPHVVQQLQSYLNRLKKIGENNPAFLLAWNFDHVHQFVVIANEVGLQMQQSPFITSLPDQMTVATITNDIVGHLATVAGGRCGNICLAPKNMLQYSNLLMVLGFIQSDPFMQQVAQQLPQGSALATAYIMFDRRLANATPIGFVPPNLQQRQLFY